MTQRCPLAGTVHKVMTAIEMDSAKEADDIFRTLTEKGVAMHGPPKAYPWNAYACTSPIRTAISGRSTPDGYHQTFEET